MEIMIKRSENDSKDVNGDKLWDDDKFGFKIAYAIRLKGRVWKIKKPGKEWEGRSTDWNVEKEQSWCKHDLFHSISNINLIY